MALAYCGYWAAIASALENDFSSWACVLAVIWAAFGDRGDGGRHGRRVAGRQQRAEDRLHERPAEVALEVGRA